MQRLIELHCAGRGSAGGGRHSQADRGYTHTHVSAIHLIYINMPSMLYHTSPPSGAIINAAESVPSGAYLPSEQFPSTHRPASLHNVRPAFLISPLWILHRSSDTNTRILHLPLLQAHSPGCTHSKSARRTHKMPRLTITPSYRATQIHTIEIHICIKWH